MYNHYTHAYWGVHMCREISVNHSLALVLIVPDVIRKAMKSSVVSAVMHGFCSMQARFFAVWLLTAYNLRRSWLPGGKP